MDLHPEGIAFLYELDIVGAPIFVKIDFDRFLITNPKTAVSKEFIKNIKYQNMKLIWTKRRMHVRFGEKATLVPSELMTKLSRIGSKNCYTFMLFLFDSVRRIEK